MNQPSRLPLVLDLTDVTGQLGSNFERVYRHDAEVFASWIQDQGLTLGTLHLLTRSHLIAYRKYLSETYAKATAARMFSVVRCVLQEYVYQGTLIVNGSGTHSVCLFANNSNKQPMLRWAHLCSWASIGKIIQQQKESVISSWNAW